MSAPGAQRADMAGPPDLEAGDALGGHGRRRTAALFRWLHIYVSMASFGILFFFAVTGLTLNHAEWFFSERDATTKTSGALNLAWANPAREQDVAKLEIVEHLRRQHGVKGNVAEFRIDVPECTIVFKGPGYSAEARLDRQTGRYELAETRMGFVAVMNDLHKGRDTGPAWSLVVDLSAVLMVVVSLTGMVLIFFLKRRFVSGLLTAGIGAAVAIALYVSFVR
ncbi:MAG TPA: PepSY-associated TM helix domain-containing protein [Opitutaceae bacterium]|nr:PepSY-associated TM helix domain-containing protein [Opitutaceae bacterium]